MTSTVKWLWLTLWACLGISESKSWYCLVLDTFWCLNLNVGDGNVFTISLVTCTCHELIRQNHFRVSKKKRNQKACWITIIRQIYNIQCVQLCISLKLFSVLVFTKGKINTMFNITLPIHPSCFVKSTKSPLVNGISYIIGYYLLVSNFRLQKRPWWL